MVRAIFITLLIIPIFTFAQSSLGGRSTVYLDAELNGTSKKNAIFEGTVVQSTPEVVIQCSYDNGKAMFIGSYTDKKLQVKHGTTKYFHYNGVLQAEGKMVNNKKEGVWRYWYDNKQMQDSGSYNEGYLVGLWRAWHPNGALKSELNFKPYFLTSVHANKESIKKVAGTKLEGPCQLYHDNGVKEATGIYDSGRNIGKWEWFWENGMPSTIEYYDRIGKLDSMRCFDSAGKYQGEFCSIDKPALLKGFGNFSEYVTMNFRWPESTNKIKQRNYVKVTFLVTSAGKMEQLRVESSERLLAETVHRFIKQLPDWYPAVSHNRERSWKAELKIPFLPLQKLTYSSDFEIPLPPPPIMD